MATNPDSLKLDREAMRLAKPSVGGVAWPTIAFAIGVAAVYAGTIAAVSIGRLGMAAGFGICSLLVYAAYTVLHEAVHSNISGFGQPTRWYNETLGMIAGFIMAIPLTIHRAEHLAHHRKTNDPEDDPDMVLAISGRPNLGSLFVASLRSIVKQYTFYWSSAWPTTTREERVKASAEMFVIVAGRLGLAVAGFPLEALMLTVLANLVGNLIIVTFFAVAVHHPNTGHGRYLDTSTLLFPGWVNAPITWLWLWQNYHSIHHLFPRVPFYRYTTVFERIRPIMVAQGAPIHQIG